MEFVFISRLTINNIAPKLQKWWTHKVAFGIISKMLKQPNFLYSQPYILLEDSLAKFYLSMTFGLSFMASSVALTRSWTSYKYLTTKIGNRNQCQSIPSLTIPSPPRATPRSTHLQSFTFL